MRKPTITIFSLLAASALVFGSLACTPKSRRFKKKVRAGQEYQKTVSQTDQKLKAAQEEKTALENQLRAAQTAAKNAAEASKKKLDEKDQRIADLEEAAETGECIECTTLREKIQEKDDQIAELTAKLDNCKSGNLLECGLTQAQIDAILGRDSDSETSDTAEEFVPGDEGVAAVGDILHTVSSDWIHYVELNNSKDADDATTQVFADDEQEIELAEFLANVDGSFKELHAKNCIDGSNCLKVEIRLIPFVDKTGSDEANQKTALSRLDFMKTHLLSITELAVLSGDVKFIEKENETLMQLADGYSKPDRGVLMILSIVKPVRAVAEPMD
jgi:DNA repair exonuclease SbcCD ATPase subunit